MISVICVWNNEEQYQNILIHSLNIQDCDYELISIDNRNHAFTSCAAALNWGADHSTGEILIFTHQDISFEKKSSLKEFGQFIKAHPDIIIGAFGAKQKAYSEDYLCDTVDECCFGMTREVFDSLRFNEKVCNGWHLYAVEMCLRAKERTKFGGGVCNPGIRHFSGGNVDLSYMKKFKQLLVMYKHQGYICTTCKKMPCNMVYYCVYFFAWRIKKLLMGNYPLVQTVKSFFSK